MKSRNIWVRRKKAKGKPASYVVEGKRGKKALFLWTISNDITRLLRHLIKTSFWSEQKTAKMSRILDSLDIKENIAKKDTKKFIQ